MTPAPSSSVDVFTVLTDDVPDTVIAALRPLLTPDEQARELRLYRDRDRRAFVITRALVRTRLSAHGPTAPGDWRFDTNAYGCPSVVAAQAGTPRLEFNLSHTAGLVSLAVTRGRLVGVDVEHTARPVRAQLPERYFAPDEVRDLRALPDADQPGAFFEYWTLKEAYIKARGMGLAIPLRDFAFELRPPAPPRVRFVDGFDDDPGRWTFWQTWPTAAHRLSLAVEAREAADLEVRLTATPAEALVP